MKWCSLRATRRIIWWR